MFEFTFKRLIFTICEMGFASLSQTRESKGDVVYLHSNNDEDCSVGSSKKVVARLQCTLVNDLRQDEQELQSLVKKNCKYEIRRAKKEGAIVSFYQNQDCLEIIDSFEGTYNLMFESKRLYGYRFNRKLVLAGIRSGNIVISTCTDICGVVTVFHAYLVDGTSTILMYSASPLWKDGQKEKANLIGRMNKCLHWEDMLFFKGQNYINYEWGGLSSFENPNGIDKFKMEFGGETRSYYNYLVPKTVLGKVYVWLIERREKKNGNHPD